MAFEERASQAVAAAAGAAAAAAAAAAADGAKKDLSAPGTAAPTTKAQQHLIPVSGVACAAVLLLLLLLLLTWQVALPPWPLLVLPLVAHPGRQAGRPRPASCPMLPMHALAACSRLDMCLLPPRLRGSH